MPEPPSGAPRSTVVDRVVQPIQEFINTEVASGAVLLFAAVITILLANSPWDENYADLFDTRITIDGGLFRIDEDLRHWINDALMTLSSAIPRTGAGSTIQARRSCGESTRAPNCSSRSISWRPSGNLMVIFTDGRDDETMLGDRRMDQIMADARRARIPLYMIRTAFNMKLGDVKEDKIWKPAVESTGGRFYPAANEQTLLSVVAEIDKLAAGRIDTVEYTVQRPRFGGYVLIAIALWLTAAVLKLGIPVPSAAFRDCRSTLLWRSAVIVVTEVLMQRS